jgi:signal peptidase I
MEEERTHQRTGISLAVEFVVIFVVAYILAYGLQNYIFGNFQIQQHSMEPTLYENDRVLINRVVYYYSQPQRRDIVILLDPTGSRNDFVKRVVALPGEVIEIRDGQTYVNNKRVDEFYLSTDLSNENVGPLRVPDDSYFVMGDNRTVSSDSRRFGPVKRDNILGKVMVVWWPVNHSQIPRQ